VAAPRDTDPSLDLAVGLLTVARRGV